MKIKKCFEKTCAECGKKLTIFQRYSHPILGKNKCVCFQCFETIQKSESSYNKFIMNSLHQKKGFPCYVLIHTAPRSEKKVCTELSNLNEISEFYPLLGEHDILTKLQMNTYTELSSFLTQKIRTIKGVQNTRTLTGAFSLTGIPHQKQKVKKRPVK